MSSTVTDRLNGALASLAIKAPVAAITTGNITLSGLSPGSVTYGYGVSALTEGMRVLVKSQTDTKQNGIYAASTSTWTRTPDFDGNRDVVNGTLVVFPLSIGQGALYQVQTTSSPVIIGTSLISFGLRDTPAITYPITAAETNVGAVPVNTAYPELYVDRYGTNTTPGTTDMSAAILAARNVAENKGGGRVIFLASSYYSSTQLRQGMWVIFQGQSPSATTLTFGTGSAGRKDLLWETSGGSYVFGARIEDMTVIVGTNSAWGLWTQGAHQHSGLERVTFTNINQVGFEFGSTGGPARMDFDSVECEYGTSNPVTTTLNGNTVTGATVIPVASTSGFFVGQHVSLQLDTSSKGEWHHSTVASISAGVSVTINHTTPANASTGKTFKASRLGGVINNGSKNCFHGGFDVEGNASFPFDLGLKLLYGHVVAEYIAGEDCHTVLLCAQSVDAGMSNQVHVLTGGAVNSNPDLLTIASNFQGRVRIGQISGSPGWRVNNLRTNELLGNYIWSGYDYTSPIVTPGSYNEAGIAYERTNHPATNAGNWTNRAAQRNFNIAASSRIHGVLHGLDAQRDAIAYGLSYDGTGYETVLANADTVGGSLTEKFRLGRLRNTSALPLVVPSYAKASLPSASPAGQIIYVTDEAGGATIAFSDNANWRRVADRAVVS